MKVPRIRATRKASRKRHFFFCATIAILHASLRTGVTFWNSRSEEPSVPTKPQATDPLERSHPPLKPLQDDEADYDKLGMEKLAEMTAMVRHSAICGDVPLEWSTAFLVLMALNDPPEEQVEEQERKTLALREKIGDAQWCLLYSVEMKEAYLVQQFVAHQ